MFNPTSEVQNIENRVFHNVPFANSRFPNGGYSLDDLWYHTNHSAWLISLPCNLWWIIWTLYFPWNRCVCSLQASFRIAIFGFVEEWFGSIFAYYSNLESYLSWLIKLSMASKLISSACVENWDDCGEGLTQKIINFLDTDT